MANYYYFLWETIDTSSLSCFLSHPYEVFADWTFTFGKPDPDFGSNSKFTVETLVSVCWWKISKLPTTVRPNSRYSACSELPILVQGEAEAFQRTPEYMVSSYRIRTVRIDLRLVAKVVLLVLRFECKFDKLWLRTTCRKPRRGHAFHRLTSDRRDDQCIRENRELRGCGAIVGIQFEFKKKNAN